MIEAIDFNIGDLVEVSITTTQELGIVVKLGREYPDPGVSKYRSQFADIKWHDIKEPCRIYKCYDSWNLVEVVVRAKT